MIGMLHAKHLKNPDPKLEAHFVSKKTIETPRKHTPRTKTQAIRRILAKGNKAYLVEEDNESLEECFGPNKNIDYYDPDAYDDEEDHLLDEEPDANFTSTVTPTKSSGPQCRTCLVYFTSNNKLHQHLRKDNCKRMTQIACAVTQNIPTHVPKATQPTSTSTVRKVIDSAVDSSQEIGTGYGFRGWKYATGTASFAETEGLFSPESCCFDSGAGVTLVDQGFFQRQAGDRISICTMATPIPSLYKTAMIIHYASLETFALGTLLKWSALTPLLLRLQS